MQITKYFLNKQEKVNNTNEHESEKKTFQLVETDLPCFGGSNKKNLLVSKANISPDYESRNKNNKISVKSSSIDEVNNLKSNNRFSNISKDSIRNDSQYKDDSIFKGQLVHYS